MLNIFSKKIFLIMLLCLFLNLKANDSLFNPSNEKESLFLRRIAEFWEDKEFEITKSEINNFISENPSSKILDSLYALIGNIYVNENSLEKAISSYDNIKQEEIKEKIAINLLASLYHLKWYSRLSKECEIFENKASDEIKNKIVYLHGLGLYNEYIESNDANTLNNAKEKFESLLDSSFQTQALEYLSQIYKNSNDFEKAAKYYLDLYEKDDQKKDEYLFEAAILTTCFDKEKALGLLDKLIESPIDNISSDAAINKLIVLLEMKRLDTIIEIKDEILKKIALTKEPLGNFYIAKAYFNLENFSKSISYLEKSLNMDSENSNELKQTYNMLLQSAFHLNNLSLFNNSFDDYVSKFPDDTSLSENLFAKAILNKRNDNFEIAKKDFQKISKDFPNIAKTEKFLFEYADFLFQTNETKIARESFKELIDNYPNHELIKSTLIKLTNCTIKDIKNETSDDNLKVLRETLITDISTLLEKEFLFTDREKLQYKSILGKTNFDLGNYNVSLEILNALLKENKHKTDNNSENNLDNESLKDTKTQTLAILSNDELSEIYFLIGFCHKNINDNLDEFIKCIKFSIELATSDKNKFNNYINLFNSYLSLSKKNLDNKELEKENISEAANYLYLAYEIDFSKITKSNLTWLSNYYFDQVKTYLGKNYKNSLENDLFIKSISQKAIKILTDTIDEKDDNFEEQNLKLAYLLKSNNSFQEAICILEKNINNYRFLPEKNFEFFEETIYELAKIFEKENQKEKAISLYEEFLLSFKNESIFKSFANLHNSRLKLSNIPKENLTSSNKELEKIISNLKTISLQKIFESEPAHLEAALDYVDLVCYMNVKKRWEKKLFLLGRLKESFNSTKDVISQDYQSTKNSLKELSKIFDSYMKVIDAEKLICLGFLEKDKTQIAKAKELLNEISKNDEICTEYLEKRFLTTFSLIKDFEVEN